MAKQENRSNQLRRKLHVFTLAKLGLRMNQPGTASQCPSARNCQTTWRRTMWRNIIQILPCCRRISLRQHIQCILLCFNRHGLSWMIFHVPCCTVAEAELVFNCMHLTFVVWRSGEHSASPYKHRCKYVHASCVNFISTLYKSKEAIVSGPKTTQPVPN